MRASYFDPSTEATIDDEVHDSAGLTRLAELVSGLRSGRGIPTIELDRADGSVLAFSFDRDRVFLVWTDADGRSHHSVGRSFATPLVFDYFGSWSEAPAEQLVGLEDALVSIDTYLSTGSPCTDAVPFDLD